MGTPKRPTPKAKKPSVGSRVTRAVDKGVKFVSDTYNDVGNMTIGKDVAGWVGRKVAPKATSRVAQSALGRTATAIGSAAFSDAVMIPMTGYGIADTAYNGIDGQGTSLSRAVNRGINRTLSKFDSSRQRRIREENESRRVHNRILGREEGFWEGILNDLKTRRRIESEPYKKRK